MSFAKKLKCVPYLERAEKLVDLLKTRSSLKASHFQEALSLCFLHHQSTVFSLMANNNLLHLCKGFSKQEWVKIFNVTWIMDNYIIFTLLVKYLPTIPLCPNDIQYRLMKKDYDLSK